MTETVSTLIELGFKDISNVEFDGEEKIFQWLDPDTGTNLMAWILDNGNVKITDGRTALERVYWEGPSAELSSIIAGYEGNLRAGFDPLK